MPQPEILQLGRRLANEIGDDDGRDSIRRWLAHHLAELIEAAPRDPAAADQAVDTILRIWATRETLPGNAWPLARYREAVTVLERLSPAVEPWRRLRNADDAAAMADLFSALNRLMLMALLIHVPPAHRLADDGVPAEAMDEDESNLVAALNELMCFLNQPKHAPQVPKVMVTIVAPSADPEPESDPTESEDEANAVAEEGLTDRHLVELIREQVGELHGALDAVLASTEGLIAKRGGGIAHETS